MTTYTIYLGATPIACVSGAEAAYACFEAAKTIAEMTNRTACIVWDDTGEILDDFGEEEEFECVCEADDEYFDECDLEEGYDPYMGCYTGDC